MIKVDEEQLAAVISSDANCEERSDVDLNAKLWQIIEIQSISVATNPVSVATKIRLVATLIWPTVGLSRKAHKIEFWHFRDDGISQNFESFLESEKVK